MLDPYYDPGNPAAQANATNQGHLYLNLGEISEDVLRDGRKQYENGLPEQGSTQPTVTSVWGKQPAAQSLIYAFDTNEANRTVQDVGFDGLSDADEATTYPNYASQPDPSADNYQYF